MSRTLFNFDVGQSLPYPRIRFASTWWTLCIETNELVPRSPITRVKLLAVSPTLWGKNPWSRKEPTLLGASACAATVKCISLPRSRPTVLILAAQWGITLVKGNNFLNILTLLRITGRKSLLVATVTIFDAQALASLLPGPES